LSMTSITIKPAHVFPPSDLELGADLQRFGRLGFLLAACFASMSWLLWLARKLMSIGRGHSAFGRLFNHVNRCSSAERQFYGSRCRKAVSIGLSIW